MAGAGQPWSELFLLVLDINKQIILDLNLLRYMPLTWPLGHIGTAVSKPEEDKDIPKPSATPYLTLVMPFILFLLFGEKKLQNNFVLQNNCFFVHCEEKVLSENLKVGHLTSMAAATRSWALAYLCIFHLPQQFGQV